MGITEPVSGHGESVLPPGAWLDGRHAKPGSCEDGLSYLDTVGRDWGTVSPSRHRGILVVLRKRGRLTTRRCSGCGKCCTCRKLGGYVCAGGHVLGGQRERWQ